MSQKEEKVESRSVYEKHGTVTEITISALQAKDVHSIRWDEGETSFELGEGYSPGFIGGQQGWSTFETNTTQPIVSAANSSDGIWSLELAEDPSATGNVGAFIPLFTNSGTIQRYIFDVLIEATGGADYQIVVQAPSQGFLTARVLFDWNPGNIRVLDEVAGDLNFINTGVSYLIDEWAELEIVLDNDAETIDYYYNDVLIYEGTMFAGSTGEQYVILHDNWNDGESGFVDNIRMFEEGNGIDPPPPPDAGDDCTDPIVVDAFPFEDLGQTTCGRGNNYSSTCLGNYDGGEDIHYQFTLTEEQFVTITMDPKGSEWTGMLLTDQCPPPGADCIATSTGSSGIRVIEEILEAGTYYIMISTWPPPACIPNFDLTITTADPPPYCLAGPTSLIDSNVERVLISGENDTEIDHTGCDPAVIGVEDLTHLSVDLYRGETYTLEVTFGTCGGNWAGAGSVWIDWDQDFEFDPADLIHQSTGRPGDAPWDGPVIIEFTVPATAKLGNTVMRVMQQEGSNVPLPLNPCATFSWGSVMDFGINIPTARVQIIHNSALAGAVDIFADGELLLGGLDFRHATAFLDLPAEVVLELDIAPAGEGIAESVLNTNVEFDADGTYIVVAAGNLQDKETSFNIFKFDEGREEATNAANTDVLAFHGSTDAGTVSIWETTIENEEDEIIDDFSFGDFAGYLELPTKNYLLQVRDATGETIATFYVPLANRNLHGEAVVLLASGFLNPPDKSDPLAFGLYMAPLGGGALIPLGDPPLIPISNWALYLGIILMISFVMIRFRRMI